MGFPVPLSMWMKGDLHDFVADMLLSQKARERGLFDANAIERKLGTSSAFSRSLWGALSLELWHQQFVDQAAAG